MAWNKVRQQLESFLTPNLIGIVEYKASGYGYKSDKAANCYISVNNKDVFNNREASILWYKTEQEAQKDENVIIHLSEEEINQVRKNGGGKIPEDRLGVIAKDNKLLRYGKEALRAQGNLYKKDFQKQAATFLTTAVEQSLESDEIILNVLAIIDRRVGKKRLEKMKSIMEMKHPAVRYFYQLRINGRVE